VKQSSVISYAILGQEFILRSNNGRESKNCFRN